MKRVLFVDDEPPILEALQGALRKQRRKWNMVFALGPEAALKELAKEPFDVVVSDMRMPKMDGADLLARVKEVSPAAVRIILSGHAEREAIVRAMSVAHRYLSKPCDLATLQETIERACQLQSLLENGALREIVANIARLPSVPKTFLELTNACARLDCSARELAAIVERDAAMAAKVLQLANSSYFGLAREVTSVAQAVTLLGVEVLKGLALTANIFAASNGARIRSETIEELQDHALAVAALAKQFLSDDPSLAAAAFTAGIVHDIGRTVLASRYGELYEEALRDAEVAGRTAWSIERERFGASHAEVGAYLLGVWGLPMKIVEAVAHHHDPSLASEPACTLAAALQVAGETLHRGSVAPASDPFPQNPALAARVAAWRSAARPADRP